MTDKVELIRKEIERLAEVGRSNAMCFDETRSEKAVWLQQADVCNRILSFINTLEEKEVDYRPIDKDFERDAVNFCIDNGLNTTPRIARTIAKHFFEFGLKAQKGMYEKQ